MKVDVLGVKVDDVSLDEAVKKVLHWLQKGGKHYIVTPNPEFVVMAQKDKQFRQIINRADLAIPDGVGFRVFKKTQNRTTGVDLVERLCKKACEKGFTVGFLGGRGGVAEKAGKRLSQKYPGLKVVFAEDGPEVDDQGQVVSSKYLGKETKKPLILDTNPLSPVDILFVAFGQGKQEKWIAKNLPKLPAKVAMGVGRTFDYLSGQLPRAPKLVRALGFEWLFSLAVQPWRIKRQLSLIKFARLVLH